MPSVSAQIAGGSTNGRSVKVTSTTSGGANTLHTAHATLIDDCIITLITTGTAQVAATLLLGGTTNPDDYWPVTLQPGVPWTFRGRFTGSVVLKVFAGSANVVVARCEVNRVSA